LVVQGANTILEFVGNLSRTSENANFLAQPFSLGLSFLNFRDLMSFCSIYGEQFIYLGCVVAATGREPAFHKVGLFTNEPDVEHGQERDRINWINKKFLILQILSILSKTASETA
jgi:hypothetical protein